MDNAVFTRNRVWSSSASGLPYEVVTGRIPDLRQIRVLGCAAYVHVDKSRRGKLDDRAWQGVFVGCATDSPVWLIYNPRTRRVERSRNVVFDESRMTGSVVMGEKLGNEDAPAFFTIDVPAVSRWGVHLGYTG